MAVTLAEFTPEIGPSALRSWSKGLRPGIDEVTVRTTPGGRTYICETGQHRYHRDVEAARWCAWRATPMAKVEWEPAQERENPTDDMGETLPNHGVLPSPEVEAAQERESTPSGDILDRINIAIWRLERKGQRVTHIELNAEDYAALKDRIARDFTLVKRDSSDFSGAIPVPVFGVPIERGRETAVSRAVVFMEEVI